MPLHKVVCPRCGKTVGEIETGRAAFVCKNSKCKKKVVAIIANGTVQTEPFQDRIVAVKK